MNNANLKNALGYSASNPEHKAWFRFKRNGDRFAVTRGGLASALTRAFGWPTAFTMREIERREADPEPEFRIGEARYRYESMDELP